MKAILVILDGLNYTTALQTMGYLQALCQRNIGKLYRVSSELPALSRPLYECLLTGVAPIESGVVNNGVVRLSNQQSIFHYARAKGLTTAAAAYYWVSELYNNAPFEPVRDRHTYNADLPIQYGHFYYEDHYPDSHLFADGDSLRHYHQPDFILFHSMNIDDIGHKYGQDSRQYREAARNADNLLSICLPKWLDEGYQVIVTADHGMNNDGNHRADSETEARVPFYVFGEVFSLLDTEILQTQICGTICQILGVDHDKPFCAELLK
ncbi:type I phosphodiesterase/nucleotide pyrophosphatase [Nicoletella semolina]|uniref:Type I phosphodiesterase/nucleotide pyrophosphatase n=1 Tax=Nicoletella semolina TaxID=271160 RepID=A0A4R2N6V7_9PAST|nr:alkaline phosphatase family protein [Nicoletella semolina]MDH2924742.1 nucleotide pyrophosphatase [Nicoletella semolina]TCP16634.1 type I phosphodiesterase/nucleotide pyrophosphatase [Nicoletella semolina]